MVLPFLSFSILSGYLDSNQGLPAPKAGALTGLRYTPNSRFERCKGTLFFRYGKSMRVIFIFF